jgi:hypothetical protein
VAQKQGHCDQQGQQVKNRAKDDEGAENGGGVVVGNEFENDYF